MANWLYIIGGILLIAVGTIAMTVGGMRKSKVDADEAGQAAEAQLRDLTAKIDKLSSLPKAQVTTQMVTDVRNDFYQWAAGLQTNQGNRRLAYDKMVLAAQESQLRASASLRDKYQCFLTALRDAVASCQQAGFQGLTLESHPLPENLYLIDYKQPVSRIVFADKTAWDVFIRPDRDDPSLPAPSILLVFGDSNDKSILRQVQPADGALINLHPDGDRRWISASGKIAYAMADLVQRKAKLSESGEFLKDIAKRMLEYQVSTAAPTTQQAVR